MLLFCFLFYGKLRFHRIKTLRLNCVEITARRQIGRIMEKIRYSKIIFNMILILILILGILQVKKLEEDRSKNADDYYTYGEISWETSKLTFDVNASQAIQELNDQQNANDGISLEYVIELGTIMHLPENYYTGLVDPIRENRHIISKEEWEAIYEYVVLYSELSAIVVRQVYITETKLIGNNGERYTFENVNLDACFNRVMDVYVQTMETEEWDGLVLKVKGAGTGTVTFQNAYVKMQDQKLADVYFENEVFTISCSDSSWSTETAGVADVILSGNEITELVFKEALVTAKVINIQEDRMQLKDTGTYEISESFKIYNIYGKIAEEPSANVLLGYQQVSFVIEDEKIQAAVITESLSTKNIRVLLSDADTGYYQSYVEFTSDTDFSVNYGEKLVCYQASDIITIDKENSEGITQITVASNEPSGTITMMSLHKSGGTPSYRGSIEIVEKEEGFIIINELPVEEYLYSVVSSEMPATYEIEALKVQAICARGYAYSRLDSNAYSDYGAHLDDTTACQVYNNIPETESTIYAVKDTFGIVPMYEGEIIDAYYFSTSGGTTCSNDAVWNGEKKAYLNANMETPDAETPALSSEEDFRYFIDNGQEYDTFEKALPFYRWSVFYTCEEMTEAVNQTLEARMAASLDHFSVVHTDGSIQIADAPLSSIGTITEIIVTKRGESGIILEMQIVGEAATLLVSGQTNIRQLFSPEQVVITKQDGTENSGWTSLPSPFYYVEKDEASGGFQIKGGGFGHGVGMSQNGANEMAKCGYSYEEIIKHYYNGVTLEKIISDTSE